MTYSAAAKKAVFDGIRQAIPDTSLTVSRWAELNRVVDRGARRGPWRNDVLPFLTEIMDAYCDPDVREIVFMKSSQVGGSEAIVNMIGYAIDVRPGEMCYMAETEDKARAWTQESFDPTVRTTERLKYLVKSSSGDNNQHVKAFPLGRLNILWATSPSQLSSRPIRDAFCDEKAGYKVTREGDAVKLVKARQKTYTGEEKLVLVSSPRNADDEADISHDYERGDRREFYVPCPSCDHFQTLQWKNLIFGEDPDNPVYACVECGFAIEEFDREEMLARGEWRASQPFNGVASFRINQLYSPFVPWARMVADFLDAKKFQTTLQVFVNTALGEPWRPDERIDYAELSLNREDYAAQVPDGVLLLTAGVDVQGDRLECEVVGWGRDHESWSIDYRVFEGSPSALDVWEQLADWLSGGFEGVGATHRVAAACIDSGGHHTQMVYKFAHANRDHRWFAIKGSSVPGNPAVSKPKMVGKNPKVRLFSLGTDTIKDEIFHFLKVEDPGPGYCHFPANDTYDADYLRQLCSEKKMPRFRMGREYHIYEKVGPSVRNEALDCRVYATAARMILNPNYDKIARRRIPLAADSERSATQDSRLATHDSRLTTPDSSAAKPRFRVINNEFYGQDI